MNIDEKEYAKLLKLKEQLEDIKDKRNKYTLNWREKNRDKYNEYHREYRKRAIKGE